MGEVRVMVDRQEEEGEDCKVFRYCITLFTDRYTTRQRNGGDACML
jgi:hypothetical protein